MAFVHEELTNQRWFQDLFQDFHRLLERCAVQPYSLDRNGDRIDHTIQSECDCLRIEIRNERQVVVVELERGSGFIAELVDTDYSDGGDFGDLTLTNPKEGLKVVVGDVLAFRDPIKAIMSLMDPAPRLRQKEIE
jgi:hypothetical protein